MVSPDQKIANAVGGKTARACDSCIRKRARWYCAADDAFLCQGCDASVHSANPLARRHERVRLKTSSTTKESSEESSLPSWHKGFTRKARTPRNGNKGAFRRSSKSEESSVHILNPRTPRNGNKGAFRRSSKSEESSVQILNPLHLVPELGTDETTSYEDNEEQLLYRVPVFDPFAAQLCLSGNSNEVATPVEAEAEVVEIVGNNNESRNMFDLNSLNGLSLPSDMELAEFAADVENLLGKGLDEESFDMKKLGFLDCTERDSIDNDSPQSGELVKVEEEDEEGGVICQVDFDNHEIDLMREPFELNFDYESPLWDDEDEKVEGCGGGMVVHIKEDEGSFNHDQGADGSKKRRILRLDYGGVMAAWDDQRSPWTSGDRPDLDPSDCWPNCMGSCGIIQHHPYGGDHQMGMMMGNPAMMDGGREARVSRYREKRRTRLFSKKIRYEVRKLNAEKRPRMKGRFVKRANFATAAPPAGFPLLSK